MSDELPIEGIVVGTLDLGESDKLVRLLTAEEGRIAVVARNARRSTKRFAGATELGTRIAVMRGRGKGLRSVNQLEIVAAPLRARDDLERIAMLSYGCELCASLAPEDSPAERLYQLLVHWLAALEADPRPDAASRTALEAKAVTFAGLAPALVICAACGQLLTDPAVFDAESGGGLHARCGEGRRVQLESLHQIEHLRRTPLSDTPGMPLSTEVEWLLSDFAQHQLGRALASRAWFQGLG